MKLKRSARPESAPGGSAFSGSPVDRQPETLQASFESVLQARCYLAQGVVFRPFPFTRRWRRLEGQKHIAHCCVSETQCIDKFKAVEPTNLNTLKNCAESREIRFRRMSFVLCDMGCFRVRSHPSDSKHRAPNEPVGVLQELCMSVKRRGRLLRALALQKVSTLLSLPPRDRDGSTDRYDRADRLDPSSPIPFSQVTPDAYGHKGDRPNGHPKGPACFSPHPNLHFSEPAV